MTRAKREQGGGRRRLWRPALLSCWGGPVVATLVVLGVGVDASWAQSIEERVVTLQDGQLRLSFAAREGVCGDGDRISTRRHTEDWEGGCDEGPVRVALDVQRGAVTNIDTYVGGAWRQRAGTVVDVGMVPAAEAAEFLLGLAEREHGRIAESAIFPATLADSVETWPRLLRIAKDEGRPRAVRKAAVFWVGIVAAEVAVADLEELVRDDDADREVREAALFGLSQLGNDRGVPALLEVVHTSEDRELRKRAIFWLGQSGDPRALALFEEILTAKR